MIRAKEIQQLKIVSEYDQEIPQSQTADNPDLNNEFEAAHFCTMSEAAPIHIKFEIGQILCKFEAAHIHTKFNPYQV